MLSSTTVFIVEGDASFRRAIARLMQAARFQVVCTSCIDELLALDLPENDAVIVADLGTIRHYAETLPHQLHDQATSLPVIYLTNDDTEQTRKEARRAGAAGYFRIPVDEQALVDAIAFAAEGPGARRIS